jgi:hypothetical protein
VQCHAVVCEIVDALDNVDFTTLWPVGTECPESIESCQSWNVYAQLKVLRWPSTAARWHVCQV